jgi:hypothetical protein
MVREERDRAYLRKERSIKAQGVLFRCIAHNVRRLIDAEYRL